MRLCYVLLSSTFGMHQYTADLANRMAQVGLPDPVEVHLVTTAHAPLDRYSSLVHVHTPVETVSTGFSSEAFRFSERRKVQQVIEDLHPDVVHFAGPHIWNIPLVRALKAQGISVVHTLHDLDPHLGTRYGVLLRMWNRSIVRTADHILVHGQTYRQRLVEWGVPSQHVTWTPLLFLFVGSARLLTARKVATSFDYEPWALFFGRLERYKGLNTLFAACDMMHGKETSSPRVIVAGPGDVADLWAGALPEQLELRDYLIGDDEALDLFRRCGLLVLPYIGATQSSLIAAAYYFHKPVVVTRSGALPEYVEDGRTGRVIEPGHPPALARCLDEMLGDRDLLTRMGTAGRAWYDTHRAAEELALVEMYNRLARARMRVGDTARGRRRVAGMLHKQ